MAMRDGDGDGNGNGDGDGDGDADGCDAMYSLISDMTVLVLTRKYRDY